MSTLSAANAQSSALLTDLYQLTMLQGYFDQGMDETAVFEFFVRKLPSTRNFLLAAGLEQTLSFLENVQFAPDGARMDRESRRFSFGFRALSGKLPLHR